ncbi:MAG: prepilin-type N-terminal cleavage/methylation domain-containing protein [Candidatus Omnitrophica bacterium]|nr:prepilin-type N-terminal cleavage/methylation domain-containing protein [Candidatus Omnitrophota bacterium]MCK5289286.1 prepilin-type N-terminal cleavage/methylation domain-containing protein [Candidatus Omnitrophota bacterium]MCK5492156.1 prepilin-type N-terminal cleavage/methylation domain-containing protein [Candidatus Omnitrophota bacterium]
MRRVVFEKNTLNLKMSVCCRRGYTLIEILIVAAIVVIMSVGIISVLDIGNKSWNQEMALVGLQQEIRLAMEGMSREIRQGQNIIITGGTIIEFNIPDITDSIKYSFIGSQIVREHPSNVTQVLSNNISFLNFSRLDGIIEIQLQAKKNVLNRELIFPLIEDKFLKLKVRLRNE